jgi:hypothetical protein
MAKLVVTAWYEIFAYTGEADPYNEAAYDEQYNECVEIIKNKIRKDGKAEMIRAFTFDKGRVVED